MGMLIRRCLLAVGASALLMAGVASPAPIDTYPQVYGIRQLDVGFRLGAAGGGFKARVTLITGEALEVPLESDADTQALLRLAQIGSSGNVAMTATVESRRVLSIQCVVRPSAQ